MPAMRRGWTWMTTALFACADASIVEAELADVCGGPGPAHILPLERDEVVSEVTPALRVGDRILYGIRRFDHPITNVPIAWADPATRGYAELDARIESIDRCGDDRRVVVEDIDTLVPPHADDEPWLGYRSETRTLYWIDLEGRWAPRVLGSVAGPRSFVVRGHDVIVHREAQRDLLRFTLAGAGVSSEVLVADIERAWPATDWRGSAWPAATAIVALREDGELVAVDPRSGRIEPLAHGVQDFVAEPSARWIAWWPRPDDELSVGPVREAWLLDRETGTSTALAFEDGAALELSPYFVDVLTTLRIDTVVSGGDLRGEVAQTRFTLLPSLASTTLDREWELVGYGYGNGDWFAARTYRGTTLEPGTYVFTVEGGEVRRLAGPFPAVERDADALWYHDYLPYGGLDGAEITPADRVRLPFPTFAPEVVERRVWTSIALPGDRFAAFIAPPPSPDHARPDPRGTLSTIDGETGEHARIDHEVSPGYVVLEPHDDPIGLPWHTDEIVYQVRALGDDRTGLWRARFAP